MNLSILLRSLHILTAASFALSAGACVAEQGPASIMADPVDPDPIGADPGTTGADPGTTPQRLTEITIPVADLLSGREGILEVQRLYEDVPAKSQLLGISAGTPSMTVPFDGAAVLAVSVQDPEGGLLESVLLHGLCPLPSAPKPTNRVLEVPVEYSTIQAAIDDADPGDKVYVHPGVYTEHLHLRSGIRLIGAGAWRTVLDGAGIGENLIDVTGAEDVVVRGFTLRNVGQRVGCAKPQDPFLCAGVWYAAAVYGDGHTLDWKQPCSNTSILLTNNIIEGNDIGVMAYFRTRAVVRNNIFVGNRIAFAANHLGSEYALIKNNVFYNNQALSIASQAGYIDILNNIIALSAAGVEHEYVQTGRIRCNVFFDVDKVGDRVPIGMDGNVVIDPQFVAPEAGDYSLRSESGALDAGCFDEDLSLLTGAHKEPGAFGGPLGQWSQQEIDIADLTGR